MANILVYALHYEGAINKNSLGAVSEGSKLAAELGGEAHVILVGEGVPQDYVLAHMWFDLAASNFSSRVV